MNKTVSNIDTFLVYKLFMNTLPLKGLDNSNNNNNDYH